MVSYVNSFILMRMLFLFSCLTFNGSLRDLLFLFIIILSAIVRSVSPRSFSLDVLCYSYYSVTGNFGRWVSSENEAGFGRQPNP